MPRLATMPPDTHRQITVRPASVADSAAIARVCLLTVYQGRSAETLVRHPELPSQVHALPYLHLPSGFAFVLVESTEQTELKPETESQHRKASIVPEEGKAESETRNVVGYVVGTGETAQFERDVDASWWPTLRAKYPKDLIGTPLDRYFINLIHKGPKPSSTGPAHIHVNVIGEYKDHGYDRLLVDVALHYLRKGKHNSRSPMRCGYFVHFRIRPLIDFAQLSCNPMD